MRCGRVLSDGAPRRGFDDSPGAFAAGFGGSEERWREGRMLRGVSKGVAVDEVGLRGLIREIPDFPEPGILFRDITPLLHEPAAFRAVNDQLAEVARGWGATLVAGIEARGFLFGVPVAERLGAPFVPVRKPGKLPADRASAFYELEYGQDSLELHRDPSVAGHRVVVVDDLLATGGTAEAAVRLVRELGGTVAGLAFAIELTELRGRGRLGGYEVESVVGY